MEDNPIMQKTVIKPCNISNLKDKWYNFEIEKCSQCGGTLFYITKQKGLAYTYPYRSMKIHRGNIYMHFRLEEIGFRSVCAECGSPDRCLTKVDPDWIIEELDWFDDVRDEDYYDEIMDIISGSKKSYSFQQKEEAKKFKEKLDRWIKEQKIKDPYAEKPKKVKKKKK